MRIVHEPASRSTCMNIYICIYMYIYIYIYIYSDPGQEIHNVNVWHVAALDL